MPQPPPDATPSLLPLVRAVADADWPALETWARPLAGRCQPIAVWDVWPGPQLIPQPTLVWQAWRELPNPRPAHVRLWPHPQRQPLAYYLQWVGVLRRCHPDLRIELLSGWDLAALPDVGPSRLRQAARALKMAGGSAVGPGPAQPLGALSAERVAREKAVAEAGMAVTVRGTVDRWTPPMAVLDLAESLAPLARVGGPQAVVLVVRPPAPTASALARMGLLLRLALPAATVAVEGSPADRGLLWALGRFGLRALLVPAGGQGQAAALKS